jgi:hypothetical protein
MPTTADDDEDKSEDGNREEEKEGELVEGDVEVVELERAPARSRVILSVRRTKRDATNTMITFDRQQAVVGVAQKTVTTIDRAGHHLCMMNMFGYYRCDVSALGLGLTAKLKCLYSPILSFFSVFCFSSQVYTKELWGINPINPATTDIQLLAIGAGSPESTTLALNSCLLMSSGACNLFLSLHSLLFVRDGDLRLTHHHLHMQRAFWSVTGNSPRTIFTRYFFSLLVWPPPSLSHLPMLVCDSIGSVTSWGSL